MLMSAVHLTVPKKQHYLPRFYLGGFCKDGKLWAYDREQDAYEQRNPKTLATRKHYYTVVNEKGEKDPTVEHVLGLVESTAAQIIAKLDRGERIDYWDKIHLAQFVALMKFRVPTFERYFADVSVAGLGAMLRAIGRFARPRLHRASPMTASLRNPTAFSNPSFALIRESSCSMEMTPS